VIEDIRYAIDSGSNADDSIQFFPDSTCSGGEFAVLGFSPETGR
jgi:hypothetical protein